MAKGENGKGKRFVLCSKRMGGIRSFCSETIFFDDLYANGQKKLFFQRKATRIPRSAKKSFIIRNQRKKIMAKTFKPPPLFTFSLAHSQTLSRKSKSSLCHPPPLCLSNRLKSSLQTIFTHPAKASGKKSMEKCSPVDVCVRAGLEGEKIRENL